MYISDERIKDILVAGNYLGEDDIALVEKEQDEHGTRSFGEASLRSGFLTKDIIGQAVAEHYGVSYADLNTYHPSVAQVRKIPPEIGQKFRAILFREQDGSVIVATDEPHKEGIEAALRRVFPDVEVLISYSLSEDVDEAILAYRSPLTDRLAEKVTKKAQAPDLIAEILEDAFVQRASDIHFELEQDLRIRFRIDGVMQDVAHLPLEHYENILNRIKVEAKLRIDEHYAPQDGSFRYKAKRDKAIDIRVSVTPTLTGEKIVLRLLSEYVQNFAFQQIGLSLEHMEVLHRGVRKPFGLILVVGPTGSGKTTTLYSILKLLNDTSVNITTIEDPVEYKIPGVNQIKVNEGTGLTFARGLRSIVRQDPDIILVGEIRDKETAEIAINAALTGHLVLSTFHANDAVTAIPRLLDMGVEPFLLASTLELLVGQRLVRKLAEGCRQSFDVTASELAESFPDAAPYFDFGGQESITLYRDGCGEEMTEGYRGRSGIFELVDVVPELKDLILENPSTRELWSVARKYGATTLFEDGINKVVQGMTSLDELLRVAQPPRYSHAEEDIKQSNTSKA